MLEKLAHAKVNLGLHVLRKRLDGFHDIETVFVRIGWADVVSVEAGRGLTMTCSDPQLPVDASNTCMRAARLLAERFDVSTGARIHLEKNVPYGAGLGSGSSDAAATLTLLARLWEIDTSLEAIAGIAAEIGSDVPFFLDGRPSHATGRGTDVEPLTCDGRPYEFPFAVTVIVPEVHVATREAYGLIRPSSEARVDLAALVCANDPMRWRRQLLNDFEASQRSRHREIDIAIGHLHAAGALYASLSGSGSAVFGVFDRLSDARAAAGSGSVEIPGARMWSGFAVHAY